MQNAGIKVNCTELKTQLTHLMENYGHDGTYAEGGKEEHAIKINFKSGPMQVRIEEQPQQAPEEGGNQLQKPVKQP